MSNQLNKEPIPYLYTQGVAMNRLYYFIQLKKRGIINLEDKETNLTKFTMNKYRQMVDNYNLQNGFEKSMLSDRNSIKVFLDLLKSNKTWNEIYAQTISGLERLIAKENNNIKKNDEINILDNNNTMSESKKSIQEIMDYYNNPVPPVPETKKKKIRKVGDRVIWKFKKGNLLPPKTIKDFKPMLRPKVSYSLLQELENNEQPAPKKIKKEVLRKPVWKYSPAMKKDALEKFIKEHGIPAPDHPKRPELMLLVSDYVTHLIMDDMRRHEQGEPLQNSSRAQIEAMKAQLKGLNIPSVASVDFPEVQVISKSKKDKILEKFKKGELLFNNKLLVDKPFKNLKSKLRPKAKPQRDLKAEIEAMKAQLKGLKIPSLASVDFPEVEVKKPVKSSDDIYKELAKLQVEKDNLENTDASENKKIRSLNKNINILQDEIYKKDGKISIDKLSKIKNQVEIKKPKKEIVIDRYAEPDLSKEPPQKVTEEKMKVIISEIAKLEKKLDKVKTLEELRSTNAQIDKLTNEAQNLKSLLNSGNGRRRRNRGGNFGSDLLGVLDKIGKFGKNIPIVGPAFIPMSYSSDIGKFIKNI
jgi:hypothetical protein